jgi:NhaP-type Na+/H+ or K+/H+ antiporter
LGYVFTLGAAFFIYDIMDTTGYNGAIAVVVFSVVLGNYRHFFRSLKDYEKFLPLQKDIVEVVGVNNQITFIVRTLFFVFIGLVFNAAALRMEVFALSKLRPEYTNSIPIITAMAASGFIDTLLAFVAMRAGVNIPNLTEIILLIVILTTLVSMFSSIWLERYYHKKTY